MITTKVNTLNLATGEEMAFLVPESVGNPHEYAVAYGHFTNNSLTSWFFDKIREKKEDWKKGLVRGNKTVAMGDWCSVTTLE